MEREQIAKMLEELKDMLDMKEKIRLELRPLKTKAASVSLKRNVIRLSKGVVSGLDEEPVRYLILHELVHLKLKSIHHTNDFYRIVYSIVKEEEVKEFEEDIIAKLIELNSRGIKAVINRSGSPF